VPTELTVGWTWEEGAQSTDTELREAALVLIEQWATELPTEPGFAVAYHSLRAQGVIFPGVQLDAVSPVYTPPPSFMPVAPQAMSLSPSQRRPPPPPPPPPLAELRVAAGTRVWMLDENEVMTPVLLTAPVHQPLRCAASLLPAPFHSSSLCSPLRRLTSVVLMMSRGSRPVWQRQSTVHTVDPFGVMDGVTVVAWEQPTCTRSAALTPQQQAAVWAQLTEGDTTVEVLTAMLHELSQPQQGEQPHPAPHDDHDTLLQLVRTPPFLVIPLLTGGTPHEAHGGARRCQQAPTASTSLLDAFCCAGSVQRMHER
jgi:hypothetical protein